MLNFLDVLEQFSVNCLLDVLELSSPLAVLLVSSLNFFQSMLGSIFQLILGVSSSAFKESIINIDVDSIKGDFCRSSNHVSRINSSERNSIDSIGSSNQKISRSKGLQNNNSSTSADS